MPVAEPAGCACGGGCPRCAPAVAGLPVGRRGDPFEREADRAAERVAAMASPPVSGTTHAARRPAAPSPLPNTGLPETTGEPLPESVQAHMGSRFGHDFSRVRIHRDGRAAQSAAALHAHAYTIGQHMVFGAGGFAPGSGACRRLLAHELAHTIQQGASPPLHGPGAAAVTVTGRAAPMLQGGFWDDLWSGIQTVGRAIASAFEWVGERIRDVATWALDLIRELPARLARLGQTLVDGFWGVLTFIPDAIRALASGGLSGLGDFLWERAKNAGAWLLTLLSRVFDVLGGPEALEFIWHLITRATPLTSAERAAAQSVLGPGAIRWDQVRVAESGILSAVFALNEGRAFATFHTINLPSEGAHGRSNLAIVVHELTHVYQYERAGSLYLGQAIHAQATIGYGYGGADGLRQARAAGRHYRDFNREQQAQIAQDYYELLQSGGDRTEYEPFIAELRAGDL
ncbi:MAG TPA: DUF4157 domain-containing protein [Burkholderiales bacterium]|nr:DUF4157 domain-containing protein [Burkholderiales bacterium]